MHNHSPTCFGLRNMCLTKVGFLFVLLLVLVNVSQGRFFIIKDKTREMFASRLIRNGLKSATAIASAKPEMVSNFVIQEADLDSFEPWGGKK